MPQRQFSYRCCDKQHRGVCLSSWDCAYVLELGNLWAVAARIKRFRRGM
jgi:hypothetical protein